ncbi:hypothetical protein [Lactococcus cremoris]|uniref:hypothetical protein n=1 Tax=Lactococcus lactis subsp. cremoris TaxID=1359 RepID=UPI002FCB79DC
MMLNKNIVLRFTPTVHRLIKKEIFRYFVWLDKNYEFPKKIVIYISGGKFVFGEIAWKEKMLTNFSVFPEKGDGSILKMACGDYIELLKEYDFQDMLGIMLFSLSENIQNYYQWVDDLEFDEEKAKESAQEMLDEYWGYRKKAKA